MENEADKAVVELVYSAVAAVDYHDTVLSIVEEETSAFFYGDKSAEDVSRLIQDRVQTYLSEQQ